LLSAIWSKTDFVEEILTLNFDSISQGATSAHANRKPPLIAHQSATTLDRTDDNRSKAKEFQKQWVKKLVAISLERN